MEIEHLILASDSSVDAEKNTLSIFNLIEDIQINSPLPEVSIPAQIIVVIRRGKKEKGKISSSFKFSSFVPDANDPQWVAIPVEMPESVSRHRIRLNIIIQVKKSGLYRFQIEENGKSEIFREISLTINLDIADEKKSRLKS